MATAIRSGVITESPGEPCAWPTFESLEEGMRGIRRAVGEARRAVGEARHAGEGMAAVAVSKVRAHPLRALGMAIATGAVVGSVAGFVGGWLARART